jgi:signal transduction histidine kinase
VRRRLVLAIAGVTAGAIVLFGIPLALVLQRTYRDEELVRLQRDTVAATRNIDLPPGARDQLELPRFSGQIGIYSLAGRLVAGTGPARGDATVTRAIALRAPEGASGGDQLVVASPLFSGERVTGAVRGRRSQAAVAEKAHRAWLDIAALGIGVLILAAGAGLALGRRLAAPLEALAGVARRVGEGDFAARAPASALTEVNELSAALNASSQQIGDLVTREREFSANASHQLRTPLAALRLELESALLADDAPRRELTAGLAQVDRLEATIGTLLALARAPGPSRQGTVDLARAVRDLQSRWHGRLAAAGRPLRISVDAPSAIGRMSPAVFDEIADILVQNAYDHGAGTVSVTVREAGEALALEVADQGPGFATDPEALFARGVGSGEGIGLSLAQSLAHSAGALLQVTRARPRAQLTVLIDRAAG